MAKAIPEGLTSLTPSLAVEHALEAIAFYKKAFGAEQLACAMDPTGKKVWHAALRIGNATFFINDPAPEMGNHHSKSRLWLYSDDVDASFARAVSAGGTAKMPPTDMFWGDRCGLIVDAWGIEWMLAKHVKDMTPAEMQKAQDEFVANMKR